MSMNNAKVTHPKENYLDAVFQHFVRFEGVPDIKSCESVVAIECKYFSIFRTMG
jgi:hypothetical protein